MTTTTTESGKGPRVTFMRPKWVKIVTTFTTTSSYASVKADYFQVRGYKTKTIEIQNDTAGTTMYYKINVFSDATHPHEHTAATSVTANTDVYKTCTEVWDFIDVQVKNNSGACTGSVVVTACAT